MHAPTSTHSDEEVEEFYGMIEQAKAHCKNHEATVSMGDMEAKVGGERQGSVLGPFGLGERNDRGVKWIDWCESQNQSILNTSFQQSPRRLWTWKSPGERYKYQIDYITINSRFKRSVTHAKTYPGADCGLDCDHVPIAAVMKVKLKKVKKRKKCRVKKEW